MMCSSTNLLVEESERIPQLLLQRVLVDGVGDSVNEGAEFVKLQLARAVSIKLANQLT